MPSGVLVRQLMRVLEASICQRGDLYGLVSCEAGLGRAIFDLRDASSVQVGQRGAVSVTRVRRVCGQAGLRAPPDHATVAKGQRRRRALHAQSWQDHSQCGGRRHRQKASAEGVLAGLSRDATLNHRCLAKSAHVRLRPNHRLARADG